MHERLLAQAKEREANLAAATAKVQAAALKECSFKPQLATKPKHRGSSPRAAATVESPRLPLHERIGELQRDKALKLR